MKKAPQSEKKVQQSKARPRAAALSSFPIVGIGASAGGLEALELFFQSLPDGSGMAFVVVQHLDPTHKGIMTELLQRYTGMTVFQVKDKMRVKPNCVYLIPPNKDMTILRGVLYLFDPSAPRGLRLPIDFFFSSLAEDQNENSIGVILSGMGSDGTLGLRKIKEKGGLVLVQEPTSARFDSMPRSAIAAGVVNVIAPVEELPGALIGSLNRVRVIPGPDSLAQEVSRSGLEKVVILLRAKTGHDFSLYKKNTLYRRIERRMAVHHIDRIADYVRYLRENSQEMELLFKELLIGVTSFFRDPEVWAKLRDQAIPEMLAEFKSGGTMRAWSVGCSTGEEAYSLAMIFREALGQVNSRENIPLQIFATDLDKDAIDKARRGLYPANIKSHVSAERLKRFFTPEESSYRINKEIREMVTFATQNVIMDPPFTKMDILICRNLLIYLEPQLQKMLIPLFHYSLAQRGILLLGSAETLSTSTDIFTPIDLKLRIFRRIQSLQPYELNVFPSKQASVLVDFPKESLNLKNEPNLQSLTDHLLLQKFSPPAVLVNDKGDILYISGRTGKYLEPAAGKANWNIFAMAREGLGFDLGNTFQKARREEGTITVKGLKVGVNGGTQSVNVTVSMIKEPELLRGLVLIVFHDVAVAKTKKRAKNSPMGSARDLELEHELQALREGLETSREEMQTSQEELKSANEELQSTNEELQSTNEELTTSREEMQSLNEELQTVNAEQQSKMDELAGINDDMRNLLNSTEIVTVFLDSQLHVRRFTSGAHSLFKLISSDVGRPLSDITNELNYPEMIEEAEKVLRTLSFIEKEVSTVDERWFSVRIMPYRTMHDVIDGVVITFTEITDAKKLEEELRAENARLKRLLDSGD